MQVALVHDWLVSSRGGERVLDALLDLFPDAEIFTLIHKKGSVPPRIEDRPVHTSFLQGVPGIFTHYRHFLPLFPKAIASFDLRGFDLVVSSSHCVAKGVQVRDGARHLSYVHAPMRYMWDLFDDYFGPGRAALHTRLAARGARPFLKAWDRRSARGVHRFVANSHNIAQKVALHYGRSASVVHPPVDLTPFTRLPPERGGQGGYFLWMGAAAPYKRLDLAVEAFRRLGWPLWIAGPEGTEPELQGLPSHIRLLGHVPDEQLPELFHGARALIFPGDEDFGITPLEAQAAGRPVVAFARGGALETLTAKTGLFFSEQAVDALLEALRGFDAWEARFRPEEARAQASRFSRSRFVEQMKHEVEQALEGA